jgi:tetratricopeptide (TPR) repeat protein
VEGSVPGNRQVFSQALKRGNQFVWDKAWDKAIAEYEAALAEFPNDPIALASAGLVYTQLKRLEDALAAYRQANQSQPNDPAIISRLGEVQERLGLTDEAISAYLALGDLFSGRQAADKAIQYWEHIVQLDPDHVDTHQRLADIYKAQGKTDLAVREYTALAKIYHKLGQVDMAVAQSQAALALAPRHTGVLRTVDEITLNQQGAAPQPAATGHTTQPAITSWDITASESPEPEGRGNPVEITRDRALSDLAETIFEDATALQPRTGAMGAAARLSKAEIDALIGQALDYQTRGDVEQATAAYRRILDAMDMPAAHFNLGLLCEQGMRFDEAIEEFKQAVNHPEYTLGSHFAMGECYRALGQVDEALAHFIEVLKIVDLQTVRREQADDLIALYENLADSYTIKGDREQAITFTNSLVEFLSDRGWEDKVMEARKHLDGLTEEGNVTISLAEIFTVPNAEIVLQAITLSQEYGKRGKHYLATDVIYHAIERSPDYLPLHLRLAELLWSNGQADEAVLKLRTIADTYQARGDVRHSMNMYQRILRMTPMDIPTRTTLIKLLISHGEIDQALDQYMQLADTYYQLAQIDKARETYQDALSYAPRGSTGKLWSLKIYSHLADIDMQRIDWRRAIQNYEQVKALAPDDEKAHVSLIELYYKIGYNQRAIKELDELMMLYKTAGKMRKMIAVLEDQVHIRPDEIPLRSRLARIYIEAGMKAQAIEQLDSLGDLQLQAGQKKEAASTIGMIVKLNPPNVDDYKQLLAQLQ